jgi:hypothetical protein
VTEIKPEWVDALSVAHAEMCDEDMRESGGRYLRTMGECYVPLLKAVAPMVAADARREALEEAIADIEGCTPQGTGDIGMQRCIQEFAVRRIRALIDKEPQP